MSVQYYFPGWKSDQTYKQFDVVYGVENGGTTHSSPYFYATQDVPAGYSPSGVYTFNVASYSRSEDVVTLNYTHSGGPPFAPGSIVKVAGVASTINYTGMVTAGGSGSIQFINPGWSAGTTAAGGTINCLSPAWTTGFMFIPTYTSKFGTQNNAIVTKLGDSYAQRMPQGLNTFNQDCNLVYKDRSEREMRAIVTYVQDKGGAYTFEVLLNDQFLSNQPNQKYVSPSAEVVPVSFGRYDLTVAVMRDFNL